MSIAIEEMLIMHSLYSCRLLQNMVLTLLTLMFCLFAMAI